MTTQPKHTPGPWQIINRPESNAPIRIGRGKNLNDIAVVYDLPPQTGDAEANAAFIVRACNSHDVLIEALEDAKTSMLDSGYRNDCTVIKKIDLALAKGA